MPSSKVPDFKLGIEYGDESLRTRILTNLRSTMTEANLAYLVRSNLVVGANVIFDPKYQNLSKYDLGLSWTPATNQLVGLKHESLNAK